MSKGNRENMGTETKGFVLDIHFGGDTHFDLRCLTVVEKVLVELPPRTPSDGFDFLHERFTRAGAGVFSDTLDITEYYALDSLATSSK
jgi:hypothetical protein